jgi:hypothetical protein
MLRLIILQRAGVAYQNESLQYSLANAYSIPTCAKIYLRRTLQYVPTAQVGECVYCAIQLWIFSLTQ